MVAVVKRLKVKVNGMVNRRKVMGGGTRVKRHAQSVTLVNGSPLAKAQKEETTCR